MLVRATVALASIAYDDYSADSSASLAQCGFVGGFIPNFAIFALV